eukprot:g77183.t1
MKEMSKEGQYVGISHTRRLRDSQNYSESGTSIYLIASPGIPNLPLPMGIIGNEWHKQKNVLSRSPAVQEILHVNNGKFVFGLVVLRVRPLLKPVSLQLATVGFGCRRNTMGIVVYKWDSCPYCKAAKALLREMGKDFTEVDGKHPDHPTVPYIIVDGVGIGGYTELRAAVDNGTFVDITEISNSLANLYDIF